MQKAKSSWTKIGLFACILSICAGVGCGFWWHFDSDSKDCFAGFTILSLGCVLLFKVRNIRNIPNHTELITSQQTQLHCHTLTRFRK
jgi:hypothetical protein